MTTKTKTLTRKQQAFVDHWLSYPKASGTEAALAAYDTTSRSNAAKIANQNLNKRAVVMALQDHLSDAETAIIDTINDWGHADAPRKREIATQNAQYLHDKVTGKATTRIETQSNIVMVNIDLSPGEDHEPPPYMLEEQLTTT